MKHLSLAVVGADFDNKSGPARRSEIARCVAGEPVELRPEPKNPADINAVAVYSVRGIQIGYVRAERAPFVKAAMRHRDVMAIFQQSEKWGATIRAHLDGSAPILPDTAELRANDGARREAENADWWPDEEWPD